MDLEAVRRVVRKECPPAHNDRGRQVLLQKDPHTWTAEDIIAVYNYTSRIDIQGDPHYDSFKRWILGLMQT